MAATHPPKFYDSLSEPLQPVPKSEDNKLPFDPAKYRRLVALPPKRHVDEAFDDDDDGGDDAWNNSLPPVDNFPANHSYAPADNSYEPVDNFPAYAPPANNSYAPADNFPAPSFPAHAPPAYNTSSRTIQPLPDFMRFRNDQELIHFTELSTSGVVDERMVQLLGWIRMHEPQVIRGICREAYRYVEGSVQTPVATAQRLVPSAAPDMSFGRQQGPEMRRFQGRNDGSVGASQSGHQFPSRGQNDRYPSGRSGHQFPSHGQNDRLVAGVGRSGHQQSGGLAKRPVIQDIRWPQGPAVHHFHGGEASAGLRGGTTGAFRVPSRPRVRVPQNIESPRIRQSHGSHEGVVEIERSIDDLISEVKRERGDQVIKEEEQDRNPVWFSGHPQGDPYGRR